jgi:hypothetical protein
MLRHAHSAPVELNTFSLKAKTLFEAGLARQSNSASRGQHAMPWQSVTLLQRPHHLARSAGKTGTASHFTVRCNLAAWNL